MRDLPALAERIDRARNSLSRIHVKTRDVGRCVLCEGRTSSGMDKLCPKCADAELRDVASILAAQTQGGSDT
ncbi:MAG: hypothetical protein C0497_04255 [Gemmatimonas sp.]|nr:hypothetical protein [Gemmatimonas sp.]